MQKGLCSYTAMESRIASLLWESNVPLETERGDLLSSTLMSRDSLGASFWPALPALEDPSLEVAIVRPRFSAYNRPNCASRATVGSVGNRNCE
jgi:hypothetical protein